MGKPSGIKWGEPTSIFTLFEVGADRIVPEYRYPPVYLAEHAGMRLNIGAGAKVIWGTIPLDLPEWDADKNDIPYSDNSVEAIYALHVLEHVGDPVRLLRECQRVLMPGGTLNIVVPYYKSQGAFHDLDHKHFFGEDTWDNLFDNQYYEKNHDGWLLEVVVNLVMGFNERNLMLVTQLVKSFRRDDFRHEDQVRRLRGEM